MDLHGLESLRFSCFSCLTSNGDTGYIPFREDFSPALEALSLERPFVRLETLEMMHDRWIRSGQFPRASSLSLFNLFSQMPTLRRLTYELGLPTSWDESEHGKVVLPGLLDVCCDPQLFNLIRCPRIERFSLCDSLEDPSWTRVINECQDWTSLKKLVIHFGPDSAFHTLSNLQPGCFPSLEYLALTFEQLRFQAIEVSAVGS